MEYTNDMIFNVRYKKENINVCPKGKIKSIKKFINWAEKDGYFTITMIVSVGALILDFFMIKQFVEIINLV